MVGIDATCFFGFGLLASEDIFNVLALDPYEEYTRDMLKERIQRISTVLHSDQLNRTEWTPSAGINQVKVNLIKDFLFNENKFQPAQWDHITFRRREGWTST